MTSPSFLGHPLRPLSATLRRQADALAAEIAPGLPAPVTARAIIAWTQLYGMISFELFGQLVGSVDPSTDFFQHATEQMADLVGLPPVRATKPATASGRPAGEPGTTAG